MATPKEREPAGRNLKKGSIVRLLDLKSEKGKHMNECVAEITDNFHEGRFGVRLLTDEERTTTIKIKPMNMRVVCSSCHKDGRNFKVCSLCNIACYCNKECQRDHWKKGQHKLHCVGNMNQGNNNHEKFVNPRLIEWDKSMDHPSWGKLIQASRHNLRRVHECAGCPVAWPVSIETPAMLDCKAPSFLIVHPNMHFKVNLEYISATKCVPILSEKVEFPYEEYAKKVPHHTPAIMTFVVIGEVIWTKYDMSDMKAFFDDPSKKGAMFNWPSAECVGICPGTGKRVAYSFSKKHLLVVCNMQGNVFRGSDYRMVTRMMPRILTIEGYNELIGPSKDDRCVTARVKRTLRRSDNGEVSTTWEDVEKKFYPEALRMMNADKPKSLTASKAYEIFCSSGDYDLYERYLERTLNTRPWASRNSQK